jgi:hypothetical protein
MKKHLFNRKKNAIGLLGMVLFFLTACTSDNRCGEIINKINDNERYLFVIRFSNGSSTNNNELSVVLENDVTVDAETFTRFEKGEDYYVE